MARRSDHNREELAAMVVKAAREIVIAEGAQGVTMRKIAGKIGYAAGSIYNAVGDQDEVLRRINADTLKGLVAKLEEDGSEQGRTPIERALGIAETYIDYVSNHARLWGALLERPPLPGETVPDYYSGPRARLIAIVGETIKPFFKDEAALRQSVIALWSALQGVAGLAIGGNLAFLGEGIDSRAIARSIVQRYLSGTDN
jgi:AcrR family transcriptional regulator